MKETIEKPVGRLSWVLYDENGNKKETGMTMNQVQNAHKNKIADQMDSTPGVAPYGFMWVGTGAMGNAAATNLTTPVAGGRKAITTSTSSSATVTTVATLEAGLGTGPLTEAGMFTTNAGTDMMTTATINVTKGDLDSLQMTWTVTFA